MCFTFFILCLCVNRFQKGLITFCRGKYVYYRWMKFQFPEVRSHLAATKVMLCNIRLYTNMSPIEDINIYAGTLRYMGTSKKMSMAR